MGIHYIYISVRAYIMYAYIYMYRKSLGTKVRPSVELAVKVYKLDKKYNSYERMVI